MAASPADIRNNLDPAAVDALADQLHALSCVPLAGQPPEWPDEHRDTDRSKARFVLMGLRDDGRIPTVTPADLTADTIAKMNAGAMLTFAVWALPKETATALFKGAPTAFCKAYKAATEAYGLGVLR
jgi:hypothetical protein